MSVGSSTCSRIAVALLAGVATSAWGGTALAQAAAPAAPNPAVQAQIDALQAQVRALQSQLTELRTRVAASPQVTAPPAAAPPATDAAAPVKVDEARTSARLSQKPWYERLRLRGYTQLRYNAFLDGDETAPNGVSRLRSVHDSSISEEGGFSLRRVRLVLQGNVTDNVQLYLQHDFGAAVNNQSTTERREHFGQLRDAYVDFFPDKARRFRIRFGQSKVPFGWENLQSSSNRLALDRTDAINSGVPGERDLGIVAYYTPDQVKDTWARLEKSGQKLFGNYGAFGVGIYNGQGTNRTERNGGRMVVAMATWPFELDGLGPIFEGQVLELGGSAYVNKIRPELRTGGVSAVDFDDKRVGLHAVLYPQPFGVQAEWTWGRGPQFDTPSQSIREHRLGGGYVQVMYDAGKTPIGRMIPYARWQHYRGGWKASVNAPRLETSEVEAGVEWHFAESLELTLAYAHMKRREADERRFGRAVGDLIRTQLQFSY